MRGKGAVEYVNRECDGITPAHAGKRSQCLHQSRLCWDHPRPCGEKVGVSNREALELGSPPPMRGKGADLVLDSTVARITPAHAGKRPLPPCAQAPRRDHPRPCGEKFSYECKHMFALGSPPPMRGKVVLFPFDRCRAGITPAHAGKSWPRYTIVREWRDHPRPCGEKILHTVSRAVSQDHPRPCGEKK